MDAPSVLTATVEGGRLTLDEPLDARPYTLRQLLQHTAGVPEYGALAAYHEAVSRRDAPWSVEELLRRVVADRLLFAPGRGWTYSNVGYLFVRGLIENEMGKRFDIALRRLVFEPLGVPEVTLAREPADLDGTAWGNQSRYHPGWVYHGLAVGTPAEAALLSIASSLVSCCPPSCSGRCSRCTRWAVLSQVAPGRVRAMAWGSWSMPPRPEGDAWVTREADQGAWPRPFTLPISDRRGRWRPSRRWRIRGWWSAPSSSGEASHNFTSDTYGLDTLAAQWTSSGHGVPHNGDQNRRT